MEEPKTHDENRCPLCQGHLHVQYRADFVRQQTQVTKLCPECEGISDDALYSLH